jgi:dienelactone hydrolase
VEYHDSGVVLEGYYAFDDTAHNKQPIVLIAHDWSGRNDFFCQKAEKLAELGYVGFAIDMYGKGKIGSTKEEKKALMQPLIEDRAMLQRRILAAVTAAKTIEQADTMRVGAIGFCFGGLCVLDLARSGANLKGVVSFHGILHAPGNLSTQPLIKAKILVLHGYDDPMIPPQQVITFAAEMTKAKANWQIDMYGHAMHAFTNPEANDPSFGTVYNAQADARSSTAMKNFLTEIFHAD